MDTPAPKKAEAPHSPLTISHPIVQTVLLICAFALFVGGLFFAHNEAFRADWYKIYRFYIHIGVLGTTIALIFFTLRGHSVPSDSDSVPSDELLSGKTPSKKHKRKKEKKKDASKASSWGLPKKHISKGGLKAYKIALVVLALTAAFGYYNFARFHGHNFIHYRELIHYHFGSKYFDELGYHDLYLAFLAADRETGHKLKDVETMRDLRSNELAKVADMKEQIEGIPGKFSKEKWEEFKTDFTFYRTKESVKRWKGIVLDRGYNPSPIWTSAGKLTTRVLSRLGVDPPLAAKALAALDQILLLMMVVMVYRAFGPEVLAFVVIYFGANPLVMYDYTGGAFLRQDWLAALVIGMCFLKQKKNVPAGLFVAYSVGVRMFPAVFMIAPAFQFVYRWVTQKVFPRDLFMFGGAAALGFAILLGISFAYAGGVDSWKTFLGNTKDHDQGVYTNHVSFRNMFIYEFGNNANAYRNTGPYHHERWRIDKEERVKRLKPVYYGSVFIILGVFCWLTRKEPATSIVYSSAFLPFLFFYPANYYFMLLLPLVFYAARHAYLLIGLYGVMLVGFVTKFLISGYDVYHIWLSFMLLVMMFAFLVMQREKNKGQGLLFGLSDDPQEIGSRDERS